MTNNNNSPFVGKWAYRSFHNNPDLLATFNDLRFGAGELVIAEPSLGVVDGTLGGEGWSLALKGYLTYGNPFTIRFQGSGEIGGEPWIYDYHGFLAPSWPNGIEQRSAIVGTIVRTIPHTNNQAPAGYVASWVAVRRQD